MTNPNVPAVPPIESLEDDSDATEYSFQELLDALNESRDLILTVPSDQVTELQEGLQARKSKLNYAARQKNVEPPKDRLDFLVYPAKDSKGREIEGQTCVRVRLKARKSVDIIKMEFPSSEL